MNYDNSTIDNDILPPLDWTPIKSTKASMLKNEDIVETKKDSKVTLQSPYHQIFDKSNRSKEIDELLIHRKKYIEKMGGPYIY